MKTSLKAFACILFLLAISAIDTQAFQNRNGKVEVAKVNATSFLFRKFEGSYEQMFNEKMSFSFSAFATPKRGIPFTNFLSYQIDGLAEERDRRIFRNGRYQQYGVGAEYRYYKGDKEGLPHGFYVAPYLTAKYMIAENRFLFQEISDPNEQETIDIEAQITRVAVGASIGYQWVINNRWTIDWMIIGFGGAHTTVRAQGTAVDIPRDPNEASEEDLQDIDNLLEDIMQGIEDAEDRFAVFEVDVEKVNHRKAEGDAVGIIPDLRTQISIGVLF